MSEMSGLDATVRSSEAPKSRVPGGSLIVENGPSAGQRIALGRERLILGRAPGNDLVLPDPEVSATHCEVRATEFGPLLRDLSSTNGVKLLGHRVSSIVLHGGSVVEIGTTRIRFETSGEQVDVPMSALSEFGELYGRSKIMRQLFAKLEKVAALDLTLLVTGETGTGKELLARSVHDMSLRANHPFLVLDCGSIPRELVESVIFGHERGAFTGAGDARRGVFEEADLGTVFLDEIGDMDLELQRRLLRVLERREVIRVGSHAPKKIDVRVIAATHRELGASINRGAFREDLFFRLSQLHVTIPPLRDRPEDILDLARRFLAETAGWLTRAPTDFSPAAQAALTSAPWPGNVRQLKNVVQRAASMSSGASIGVEDLDLSPGRTRVPDFAIDLSVPFKDAKASVTARFERAYLTALMSECRGNLTHAAERAQLARHHLRRLLRERGVCYRGEE